MSVFTDKQPNIMDIMADDLCSQKEGATKESQAPKAQLYNLEEEPSETTNLYESHPEIAERLLAQLQVDVSDGSSSERPMSKNDVEGIKLCKSEKSKQTITFLL